MVARRIVVHHRPVRFPRSLHVPLRDHVPPPGGRGAVASLAGLAAGLVLIAPASAATPFVVSPQAMGHTVVTLPAGGSLPAGTSIVAYVRPSSTIADAHAVGVCRVDPGGGGCASNVELPFPGPTGTGPRAVGRAHVAYNSVGGISVYANCFFCLGDSSADSHAVAWTSANGTGFTPTPLSGTTIIDGDGTGALITASLGGSLTGGAFVQASSGSASGRGRVQPLVGGPLPAPGDLSSAYIGYRSSVVRGVGNSLVYATSDGDRIRARSFVPFMGPASNPTPAQLASPASWSPLADVVAPEPGGVDTLTLARTAGDVYVGYRHIEGGSSSVRYRRFDWNGGGGVNRFGPAMPLHAVSGLDTDTDEPAIAGDPAGRVHAIWQAKNQDQPRLRYAVTDAAGNGPVVRGNLAVGEWFYDTQLDAGAGSAGLATWRSGGGGLDVLRAVALDPQPEPEPVPAPPPGGGGGGGSPAPPAPTPPKPAPAKERKTTVSVPGGTLSLGAPRGCVRPKGSYTVRISFVAKKRGSRRSNVVVKVTRADFYVDGKRRVSDRKAPFAARLKVTTRAGGRIQVKGVARLKVKKTSKPRTRTITTTIKVCG